MNPAGGLSAQISFHETILPRLPFGDPKYTAPSPVDVGDWRWVGISRPPPINRRLGIGPIPWRSGKIPFLRCRSSGRPGDRKFAPDYGNERNPRAPSQPRCFAASTIPSTAERSAAADRAPDTPPAGASAIWNIGAIPRISPSAAGICNPHPHAADDAASETRADPPAAKCHRCAPCSDTNYSKAAGDSAPEMSPRQVSRPFSAKSSPFKARGARTAGAATKQMIPRIGHVPESIYRHRSSRRSIPPDRTVVRAGAATLFTWIVEAALS